MSCHVLGHPRPCKASLCEQIEREHQAVRASERARIVDAIRERGNKWAALRGKGPEAARAVMYEIAEELERGKL